MNIVLMAAIMGLMALFFHGKGHHKPTPPPNHHATKPDEAAAPAGASSRPAEPSREPNPDPKAPRDAEGSTPISKAE